MEFAVLGPLLVSAAGERIGIGTAAKRRLVLAALLARAGEPVPTDTLVEAVWGARSPVSARRNIQLYLHQLRRALGDDLIVAGRDGYTIEATQQLDSAEFRRLMTEGVASLDAGDPVAAAAALRTALDLWRGPAFGEFLDCELVAEEARRLELLRLEASERWAEAQLVTGATPRLVTELTDLSRQHPYREALRAHLMRSLYQAGRQAEALAVFRETRALLVEQLGVEPGPTLQRLHEAVLRGDEALIPLPRKEISLPRKGIPQAAAPRELPMDAPQFVGREQALDLLDDLPAGPVRLVVICGMGGIGKTTLAVHAAHRIADRYPDGQLFIDLHGYTQGVAPVEPAAALDRMLRALDVPGSQIPAGLDEKAALYRTRLAGRRTLIVLDNAATEQQVLPLLPGSAGCLLLATSRRRLTGLDHAHTLSLDMPPAPEAVALFTSAAGEDRLADQPPALLRELVELCGRLPLAVRIAAARLRSHPAWELSDLVDRLRGQRDRLPELAAGQRSITAALDLSYQDLDLAQRRAYRSLGLHPGPDIDGYAAAALLGTAVRQATPLLERLLDANLLLEPIAGRYRFHDLTRAHAAAVAAGDRAEPAADPALDRLLDYYRHTAALAMDAAYPYEREHRPPVDPAHTGTPHFPDPASALDWLDTELLNLLAVASYANDHGRPAHLIPLSNILHQHLRTRGRDQAAETLHNQALATARAIGDQAGQIAALSSLGHLYLRQNRIEEATECHRRALEIARATGHRAGEMDSLAGLGYIELKHGRHAQAADRYQRALRLARAIGHRTGQLDALAGLGHVHIRRGRYAQAAEHYQQALRLAHATGHRTGELHALQGLAAIHRQQGRYPSAADHFGQMLRLSRTIGHRAGELTALAGLGHVHRQQRRYARAVDYYQQLLALAGPIDDRNWLYEARQGLGRLQQATGDPAAALTHHERALALARELGQPDDEARAYDGLAHAYQALGQPERARDHWQRALDILTELGIDQTEDEEANLAAIRAHLAGLGRLRRVALD